MGKNNSRDYSLKSRLVGIFAVNVPKESIPKYLFDYADTGCASDFVMVVRRLPVGFSMKVRRNGHSQNEKIILKSGGKEVVIPRDSGEQQQGPNASRESKTTEMRAHFVSIEFREYSDLFTDRGLLWLHGGEPAEAVFLLTSRALALKEPELRAILDEAEKVIDEKVLAYFR